MSVTPCKSSWTKIFVLGMVLIVTGTISSAQTYTVTPSSLSFTGAPVGMLSLAKTVTIYNTGTTSLTVNSYSLSPEFVLIYGWAPYVIGPGKQFAFGIKFAPDAAGSFSGQFTVNLSGTDVVIPITGKGLSTRALPSVTPAEISFGEVPIGTTSTSQILTVKNAGASQHEDSGGHRQSPVHCDWARVPSFAEGRTEPELAGDVHRNDRAGIL